MTRDQAKQLLPIIQAFAEGKKVQYLADSGKWITGVDISFIRSPNLYRLAPDPVEQAWEIYTETYENSSRKDALAAVLKAIKDGTIVL